MTPYHNSQRVIPAPTTQQPSLTTFDTDFGAGDAGELVVKPTQKPWLQWMAGKLTTTTLETPVGWHIQADVDPDLDAVLAGMNTKRYIVHHPSDNGDAKQVPYWALSYGGKSCSLFVIAYGVASTRQMEQNHQERFGVAYAWQVMKDKQGQVIRRKNSNEPKRKCRVQFRACIHELVDQGYLDWFQVSISGYLTEDILAAFSAQYRVLDAFDSRMRALGREIAAPFWGYSIPFVTGASRFVKPKDGGDGTTILPMVTQIPPLEEITISYLNQHRVPRDLQKRIREQWLDETFVWSSLRSLELYEEQPLQLSAPPTEIPETQSIPTPPPPPPTPTPVPAPDAITATQVKWIKDMCGNNPAIIQAWCEKFQIADFSELKASQFSEFFNLMSQDRQ